MTQCTGPDCDRPARYLNPQPLCGAHYHQIHVRKVPLTPLVRHRRVRDGMKECSRCGEVKPVSAFNRSSGKKLQPACKTCQSVINRKQRYGVTFDEMKALMEQPCAGCGVTPGSRELHIDHCHESGKVRGVLCHNCNTVLTKHMTPAILRRLADYLDSHNVPPKE